MDEMQSFGTVEQKMLSRAILRKVPMNGSMELLPLCNMNCDMCYVRLSKAEMEAKGKMRSGDEWLSLGKEMADSGVLFMLLTGGEPLLHPDFQKIYLGLKKLGMVLTVNTNATLIDENWVDFFGKNKPRRINITLYGADNDSYERLCHHPGGFDDVVRAIKLLKDRSVDVRIGCSVTPENVTDMDRIFALARELDVYMIADTYMHPEARERSKPFKQQSRLLPEAAAEANIREILLEKGFDVLKAYAEKVIHDIDSFRPGQEEPCAASCMAGKCSFTVDWMGRLKPCVLSTEPAVNVFESGFEAAWNRVCEEFSNLRYCSACSVCPLKSICRVCPVAAKQETGDYMGKPEYLCRYAAEMARLLRQIGESDHE